MTQHGGQRKGAGRPKGRNVWGETTQPLRIPISKIDAVLHFLQQGSLHLPLYSSRVQAGFPSPADDYIEAQLDLNQFLIKHPAATFFVRAEGESMIGAHIQSGDLLIVDRSIEPSHGKIVIAAINGELTVKRLIQRQQHIFLQAENPEFPLIPIQEHTELVIWGVVTHVIHSISPCSP